MALLDIQNLVVEFQTASGPFRAVDGVSLHVDEREVLAIVGESGSGKSVSMLAVMGLLPWTATVTADRMAFNGRALLKMSPGDRRKIIGKDIAMIFHEPIASTSRSSTCKETPSTARNIPDAVWNSTTRFWMSSSAITTSSISDRAHRADRRRSD